MILRELSRTLGAPLHHQLAAVLRDGITTGRYAPGERLPGEDGLAALYGVSRVTVRRALRDLQEQGLIERRQGRGTFVARAASAPASAVDGYMARVARGRRRSRPQLLDARWVVPPPAVREALGLGRPERTLRVVRLRLRGEVPLMHSTVHLPPFVGDRFVESDFGRSALTELMQREGFSYARFEMVAGALVADAALSVQLRVAVGSALVDVRRIAYDAGGRAIEHQVIVAPPQRWQLRVEITR
jgi:GntR family transcriptional regulator